jgi:hypothetical protein
MEHGREDEEASLDAAPEGASREARPDKSATEPHAEQQDPESGAAADEGGETPSQAEG